MTKRCLDCNNPVQSWNEYCPRCGADLRKAVTAASEPSRRRGVVVKPLTLRIAGLLGR